MNTLGLILDVTVIGMLAATIGYAIRLNRRLSALRASKEELEQLVSSFASATERAEAGVEGMRRMATETGQALQKVVDKGQALRDELQFMIEAADSLATRLEGATRGRRETAEPAASEPVRPAKPVKPQRPPASDPAGDAALRVAAEPPSPPQTGAPSRAERELMQALENLR